MKIQVNKALFKKICYDMTLNNHERYNIGTYKEKKLHLILKNYFSMNKSDVPKNIQEIAYRGHIADILTDNEIIEIQTGSFGKMKAKLDSFLPDLPVNIVYPIAEKKWLSWINPDTGEITPKRASPKRGSAISILPEMIYVRNYLGRENLIFTAVMLEIEEYRYLNGWSKDKKKGSRRFERIPTDIYSIIRLETKEDYTEMIPSEEILPEPFTINEFMKAVKMNYSEAQKSTKVLTDLNIIKKTVKRGRKDQYMRLFSSVETGKN